MKKTDKRQSGIGILEVIISTSIIIVGILSVLVLFENNFHLQELNMKKLVAYNLAKEGIEIARWQRDTYWFTEQNKYSFKCGGNPCGESGPEEMAPVLENDGDPLKGWIIKKRGAGGNEGKPEIYLYYSGSDKIMFAQSDKNENNVPSSWVKTEYKRRLFFNKNNPDGDAATDDLQVISRVEYAAGKYVELEAYFYDWY